MHDNQDLSIQDFAVVVDTRAHARWLALTALIVALLPLIIGFVRYLMVIQQTIPYPYELDYGEGVVWQQMREIVAGHGFGRIDVFPSIVFNYPPVYHLVTAAFAGASGMDQLAAGRLLSAIATIAIGGMIALTVSHITKADGGGRLSWICGLIAGLLIFSMMPVLHWSRFMRVDMLALFFSFAGLYFGLRALNQPKSIHVAALFFVVAVYTKQTSLAAPVAVFATLLFLRPQTAWAGIATGALAGFAALGVLIWQTSGGFIDHIILYNINRTELSRLQWVVTMFSQHALYIGVAAIAIGQQVHRRLPAYRDSAGLAAFRDTLASNTGDIRIVMLILHLLLATVMLVTIVKAGSTYNYYMEWLCLIALFVGLALGDVERRASGDDSLAQPTLLTIALPLAVALQAYMLPDVPQDSWRMDAPRQVELDRLAQMIRTAPKPIISDDMVMLVRSGKTVQWEPAMYAELGYNGIWDDRPFIAKIRNGDFSFFITRYEGTDAVHHSSYNPKVAAAIATAYPVVRKLGGYTINLPASAP
jgi:4-amino-4-deoxy-L-arabinose transferase-like glycosyltransferase